ncbi:hypothetical protein [Paenibacillus sp. MDMC362]|uniref:hypothetical protein n=1 Tax=Paenibacillus sp. MDMC362 TaxID=2977365 RepID=UPI000DC2FA2C|nr:hypothetical protein [Paenibacillus sp. MDMC362]RAR39675.1 hypothetical protein DP091_29770 [Paenibacillus sp. MDMC362]
MYVIYDIWDEQKNIGKVNSILENPHEQQLVDNGVEVEEIPLPEQHESMRPVLFINLNTKEMYYQYWSIPERPPTLPEAVIALQQENVELRQAILELTMMMAAPQ